MIALGSLSFLDHFLLWLEMFGSDNGIEAQRNIWSLIIKFLNTISWLSTEAMILRMKSFQDEIKSHSADGTWEWPKCKRAFPPSHNAHCCVYSTDAAENSVQGLTALWLIHILGCWLKNTERKNWKFYPRANCSLSAVINLCFGTTSRPDLTFVVKQLVWNPKQNETYSNICRRFLYLEI